MKSPEEILVEIGTEGGSLSIRRFRAADGIWKFIFTRNELAMADFLDAEDQGDLIWSSPPMDSFEAALQQLNQYPWHKMTVLAVHPEFEETLQLEQERRLQQASFPGKTTSGQLTADMAMYLRRQLRDKGYPCDVYHDHGKDGDGFRGKIVSSINREYARGDELSQLDIAIVKQGTSEVWVLIEIEETNDKPKTLLSDVFGTLTGNFISLPQLGRADIGNYTTLIVLGKGRNHELRNQHIREAALSTRSALGAGNSQIGNIIVESFTTAENLKKILWDEVQKVLRELLDEPRS